MQESQRNINFEHSVLMFADLLALARIATANTPVYEKQDALITEFRKIKKPFLATMPMRHRFMCELCGLEQGESLLHFENPAVPDESEGMSMKFGKPAGIWAFIRSEQLHKILAHDEGCPGRLLQVLASVDAQ